MSAIAMVGSNLLESLVANTTQSKSHKFKQDFEQLGQDLQSGNVTRGQADLTALQSDISSPQVSPSTPNLNSQTLSQLSQDLQSGNLTAAQSDYASLQQSLLQGSGNGHHAHSHAHGAGGGALNQAQQELTQLGQALQAGNLSAAQQAYTALQSDPGSIAAFGANASAGAGSAVNLSA